jgi:hypothetical protein
MASTRETATHSEGEDRLSVPSVFFPPQRVQDTDFPRYEILVRGGKGAKDQIINVLIFRKFDGMLYGRKWADVALMRIRLNIVSPRRRR